MYDFEQYREYAKTDKEKANLELFITHGSVTNAANVTGISRNTLKSSWRQIRERAAAHGYCPESGMNHKNAPQFLTKKATIQFNGDGELKNIWYKNELDAQEIEQNIVKFAELIQKEIIKPKPKKFDKKKYSKDIIPFLEIGDGHIGLIAHKAIVGKDFNLDMAKEQMCVSVDSLIDRLPDCERCVINDLGDMTHYESTEQRTMASGHQMDADRHYGMMFEVYVEVMHFIIDKCLDKFKYVDIIINQGNHSRSNDIAMAISLRKFFENEPRVNVLDNQNVFIGYRMGNTFVMTHHGDKTRMDKLIDVMMTDFRHDFGECKYKMIDTGHIHTGKVLAERGGVVVESFNQIALGDQYAHDNGYRSRKCLTAILRSKSYGEKGRETITAEEVEDLIENCGSVVAPNNRRDVYTV